MSGRDSNTYWSAAVSGKVAELKDKSKSPEMYGRCLAFGEMAARLRVAVICNNHFSKGGGNANSRVIGSVAFVNQARAAFIVTPDVGRLAARIAGDDWPG